jgi:DNA-binding transcriptional LysR family regulator
LLAVPLGHALSKKKVVATKDLARYPFIALAETDTTRRALHALLAKEGAVLDVAIETPYSLTVASFVANGVGIGLINPIVLDAFGPDRLRLLPIKDDIWFQAMVIHSASTPLAAPAKALLKILQKTSAIER